MILSPWWCGDVVRARGVQLKKKTQKMKLFKDYTLEPTLPKVKVVSALNEKGEWVQMNSAYLDNWEYVVKLTEDHYAVRNSTCPTWHVVVGVEILDLL